MRKLLLLSVACVFMSVALEARADTPLVQPASAGVGDAPVLQQSASTDDGGFTLVKKGRTPRRRSGGDYVLKGDLAWLAAGGAGALFSLVLFTLPMLWFGPAIPFLAPLIVATVWGFLVMGAAGAIAWAIMSFFSEMRSGILIPVLASGGVGAAIALGAGLLATLVWWSGALVGWVFNPWGFNPYSPWSYFGPPTGPGGYFQWLGGVIGWLIWATGVVAAAIIGPLVGAYLYRRFGVRRTDNEFHFDLMTPGRE